MSTSVRMPNLGAEATEGRVSSWLKSAGDTVAEGEAIAEIETDKATLDLEAPASGVLREILVPAGADAPVGAVLAILDEGLALRHPAELPMTRRSGASLLACDADMDRVAQVMGIKMDRGSLRVSRGGSITG